MNSRFLLRVCIVCFLIPSAFSVVFYYFEGHRFRFEELTSYLKAQAENRTNELEQKLDRIIDLLTTIPKKCNRDVTGVVKPKSCADLRQAGVTCDGTYDIFPGGMSGPTTVKCDMTTDGGGWTVLMKRSNRGCKMISFRKDWASYRNGFGNLRKEFWIGNEIMHALSTEDDNILRIRLSTFNCEQKISEFSSFLVGNESSKYELHVGQLTNTSKVTSDEPLLLDFHGGIVPFSTYDRRNSERAKWCTITGGWWFSNCTDIFLTGEYGTDYVDLDEDMWSDSERQLSMKEAEMIIRPRDFSVNSLEHKMPFKSAL